MIASEFAPLAKTGGLADAVAGLSSALAELGHGVTVVIPRYRGLGEDAADAGSVDITLGAMRTTLRVALRTIDAPGGVRVMLVDEPVFAARDTFYGEHGGDYPDNAYRFALLSRAALAFAARESESVKGRRRAAFDIVHAHDWHASLAPVYLKTQNAGDPRAPRASVFTIHNLAFQGLFDVGDLPALDLDPGLFAIDGLEFWGRASALKGGVVFADRVTTVSPSYARETCDTEMGFGFQGILRAKGARALGILNGIDTRIWDPSNDPYLPAPYSAADLSGKAASKAAVLAEFGVAPRDGRPLFGIVSRLAHQKGTDLVREVLPWLAAEGASLVLLGAGDGALESAWRALAAAYPDRIGVRIGFDERLAHLIEAGADAFVMPSRYEPCGLNQMYSLRYGTPPVVRAVGGLNDTVEPFNPATKKGNGFKFDDPTAAALQASLADVLGVWERPAAWRALQRNGMKANHSWTRSAREYVKVYRSALGRRA
jgi:starch synthase